ncbi:fibronectin type III domain-containing protein [Paenibacillus sp. LjRoot153]|uniref:rhamnogalacturonan endolyase family protein n=1 Tax=Paenibacillus sp. LjRoot153 TaxID=3342270 RepID=UPI003ECF6D0B
MTAQALNSTQVVVSWSPATDQVGVTQYLIYRDGTLISSTSAQSQTFTDNGLSRGTARTQLRRLMIVKEDTEVPTAPTDVTAIPLSGSQIYVSWGASTDDTGVVSYAVYRDSTQIASVNAKTLNYADNTLLPNTSYTYAVKAVDTASKQSSAGGSVTTVTYSSLLQDNYEHGNLHGWKDVNGWGTWQIISEDSSNHVYANGDDTKGGLKLVAGQSV